MKRQKKLSYLLLILIITVLLSPTNTLAYKPFNSVQTGDTLYWKVLDYNETNNIVEPGQWLSEFYLHRAYYTLDIGDTIEFTVNNPAECNGTLKMGNMTLNSVPRHEIGLNLLLITGPAFPPFSNYSFDPAFISPTNWQTQIELAHNATNERTFPAVATMDITTSYMTFLDISRSVITFNFTYGDQISNTIYDNETGILLYMYAKFQLQWYELVISTTPSQIPSFNLYLSIFGLILLVLVPFGIGKLRLYPKYKATY